MEFLICFEYEPHAEQVHFFCLCQGMIPFFFYFSKHMNPNDVIGRKKNAVELEYWKCCPPNFLNTYESEYSFMKNCLLGQIIVF